MFDQAQLRKGTLEGCILKIIDREPPYGYAIATTLRDCGFADRLTPDGVQYLNDFTEAWQNASDTVNRILHDKEG